MNFDGDHERFLSTMDNVAQYGPNKWWLYLVRCQACGLYWLVAQEERIFDELLVKRIDQRAAERVQQDGFWPSDFLTYESVLRELGQRCHFPIWFDINDSPLAETIDDLRAANPALSVLEAASLVGLDENDLSLLRR